jgi:metal-sulfur cluster biosynthetic enzyme
MAHLMEGAPGARRALPVVPRPAFRAPAPQDALPRHVLSHASGGRDLWSPPLEEAPADPVEGVYACLQEVLDPEIPISLVDLGLIYGVDYEHGVAGIRLTYTATACPCMAFIQEDIRDRLLQEPWITKVELDEVWSPPWNRDMISDRGRTLLKSMGVGA